MRVQQSLRVTLRVTSHKKYAADISAGDLLPSDPARSPAVQLTQGYYRFDILLTNRSAFAFSLPTTPPDLSIIDSDGTRSALTPLALSDNSLQPDPLNGPLEPGQTAAVWSDFGNQLACVSEPQPASTTFELHVSDQATLTFTADIVTRCGSRSATSANPAPLPRRSSPTICADRFSSAGAHSPARRAPTILTSRWARTRRSVAITDS
jgi:hypothetical protein